MNIPSINQLGHKSQRSTLPAHQNKDYVNRQIYKGDIFLVSNIVPNCRRIIPSAMTINKTPLVSGRKM